MIKGFLKSGGESARFMLAGAVTFIATLSIAIVNTIPRMIKEGEASDMLSDFKNTAFFQESIVEQIQETEGQYESREITSSEYTQKLEQILSDENAEAILKSTASPLSLSYENAQRVASGLNTANVILKSISVVGLGMIIAGGTADNKRLRKTKSEDKTIEREENKIIDI